MGCGGCGPCRAGDLQICDRYYQPGFTGPGSFAELVALPYADLNLVALPESLSFVNAAVLGCRFATAYRAITSQGRTKPGEWVAVHGCGGVGLSAIMIARAVGARVVAIDIASDALNLAQDLGAEAAINARETSDVPAAVHEITGGGAHVSLEALGSKATTVNSIRCLRKRGRHVQVGLMLGGDADPALPMGAVIARELEILGSHGVPAPQYEGMMELIKQEKVKPERLLGKTVSLEEGARLLPQMQEFGNKGVTVIDLAS
jgi:alcohol dehydrogenase